MSPLDRKIYRLVSFMLLFVVALIPIKDAQADIGPHPTFFFEFDFSALDETPAVKDVILYTCQDENCAEKEELWDVPGQTFYCNQKNCSATLMTGGPVWQIEVQLEDRTLTSEPFTKEGFYSHYSLVFLPEKVEVVFVSAAEPSVSNTTTVTGSDGDEFQQIDIARAILFTIFVELPLTALFLLIFKARFLDILWVLLGNVLSLAGAWFLVPLLPLDAFAVTVIVLLMAILIEWVVLGWLSGERITWFKAAVISLVINLASTFAGLWLVY